MRALVFRDGLLEFKTDYPAPRPAPGESLIRVTMAGICATDLEIVKGYMGLEGVLGHEFVGVVEASGDRSLAGRRVAGEINLGCGGCRYCRDGLGRHCPTRSVLGILSKDGAFADFLTLPDENLHEVPDEISDEEAVFVEPLAAAFEIAEQVKIARGDRVLVLGDGRLGQLVAQVISLGTPSLLVLGRHPEKLALLQSRGIETMCRPAAGALKEAAGSPSHLSQDVPGPFDVVIDCTGAAAALEAAAALVKPRGTIVLKTTVAGRRTLDLNRLVIDEITVIGSRCGPFAPAIEALKDKTIDVWPLISRRYPLDQGIEALGFAAGKGVLKVLLDIQAPL